MAPVELLLFLLVPWGTAEAGKLLVVPQEGSHWFSIQEVVEQLGQRGHEIVVLVPELTLLIKSSKHYTLKTYQVPYTLEQHAENYRRLGMFNFDEGSLMDKLPGAKEYKALVKFTNLLFDGVMSLFNDKDLIRSLEESHFDALVTDPALPFGAILAVRLGLPFVHIFRGFPCNFEHMVTISPSPSSYIPRCYTGYSDHMDFSQRVRNFIQSYYEIALLKHMFGPYERLATTVLRQEVDILEIYGRASFWLMRYDFVFEYPRPLMPNMAFIGGFNCQEGKNLNEVEGLILPCGVILAVHLGLLFAHLFRGYPYALEHMTTNSQSPPSCSPRFYRSYYDHVDFNEQVWNFITSNLEVALLKHMDSP